MHFEQRVGLVHVRFGRALKVVNLLSHLIKSLFAGQKVNVAVHPGDLHLANFVLVHTQSVRNTRRRV